MPTLVKPFLRKRTDANTEADITRTRMWGNALESKYFGEIEFGKIINDTAKSATVESRAQRLSLTLVSNFCTL